jgi:hypothetical protein
MVMGAGLAAAPGLALVAAVLAAGFGLAGALAAGLLSLAAGLAALAGALFAGAGAAPPQAVRAVNRRAAAAV